MEQPKGPESEILLKLQRDINCLLDGVASRD